EMGIEILETASGVLACGEVGWGRLLEPDLMFLEVEKYVGKTFAAPTSATEKVPKKGSKILVTSGGTQEAIDPVRVITNKSTGSTGAAIADALTNFGFDVTYVHAENAKLPALDCEKKSFTSFGSLETGLKELLQDSSYQAVIHLAAVSDFSPTESHSKKLSVDDELILRFKRNPKLVDQLRDMAHNPELKVIAFKLTAGVSKDEQKKAVNKLFEHSNADLVVQNDMSEMMPEHMFHIFNQLQPAQDLKGKQELGFYLGEYLMKELL
ncbi:MAG: phosphopantothenoylcysteine decarboxylase domain-containing protein, partial [Pseudobdellovibrionaceae bacterium]